MIALLLVLALSTPIAPGTRPAKHADTYPKGSHDEAVAVCVEILALANPGSSVRSVNLLCDCTFWNIEDTFTYQQIKEMPDEQRRSVFMAAVEGCATQLEKKDRR